MFLEGSASSPNQLHIATVIKPDADPCFRLIDSNHVDEALDALRSDRCRIVGAPKRGVLVGHLRGRFMADGKPMSDDYAVYSIADGQEFAAIGCSGFFADTIACSKSLKELLQSPDGANGQHLRFEEAA